MSKSLVSVTGLKKRGLQFVAKAGGIKNTDKMTVIQLKEAINSLKGKNAEIANSEASREKTFFN